MTYKSTLQEHNTKLQQAIDKANALPDAGSGAPAEDLTAEIEAQAALIEEQAGQIEELLTVLEWKASGGGSGEYETCTLRVVGTIGESPNPDAEPHPTDNAYIFEVLYPCVETREDENGNLQHVIAWRNEHLYTDYVEIEGVAVGQTLCIFYTVDNEATFAEPVNAEVLCWSFNVDCALVKCTKANDTAVITIVNGV